MNNFFSNRKANGCCIGYRLSRIFRGTFFRHFRKDFTGSFRFDNRLDRIYFHFVRLKTFFPRRHGSIDEFVRYFGRFVVIGDLVGIDLVPARLRALQQQIIYLPRKVKSHFNLI